MSKIKTVQQTITIQGSSNSEMIFDEILKASQSSWWPQDLDSTIENISGTIDEGTLYFQKTRFKLGPKWHKRNVTIDRNSKYLKREFLDGMFKGGCEEFVVRNNCNNQEVVYNFCYKARGPMFRILWKLAFKKLHKKNVDKVLNALKGYIEEKSR